MGHRANMSIPLPTGQYQLGQCDLHFLDSHTFRGGSYEVASLLRGNIAVRFFAMAHQVCVLARLHHLPSTRIYCCPMILHANFSYKHLTNPSSILDATMLPNRQWIRHHSRCPSLMGPPFV